MHITFSESLKLRALALQKRLLKTFTVPRATTPVYPYPDLPIPQTPSTFGEDFDYDRSSRASSMRRSESVHSLPPTLHAPQYSHLQEEAQAISRGEGSQESRTPELPGSVTGRVLNYLGLGRAGSSPAAATYASSTSGSDRVFSRGSSMTYSSNPHITTSTRRSKAAEGPTSFKVPEMTQYQRGVPIPMTEPLRRASVAPMRDLNVSISREVEQLPILRHQEIAPRRPASGGVAAARLPALHPVTGTGLPIAIPRPRTISGSTVKDLVRSFEDLSEDSISISPPAPRGARRSRSGSNPDWRRERAASGSDAKEEEPEEVRLGDEDERAGDDTFSSSNIPRHPQSKRPSPSMSTAAEAGSPPKLQAGVVPSTAPAKRRMTFLGPWA